MQGGQRGGGEKHMGFRLARSETKGHLIAGRGEGWGKGGNGGFRLAGCEAKDYLTAGKAKGWGRGGNGV